MAKKKGKNRINVPEAVELFKAYGFSVRIVMPWHIQLRKEEYRGVCYDWYHTTGALVCIRDSYFSRATTSVDPETIALYIKDNIAQ